jgi:filamentous hemagglutinin family protein
VLSGLTVAAQANPQGGQVVAGTATITSAGKTLTVNQSSNRSVINWQSFSISAGETTRINLPSSLSAILNRVTGADPSLIAGHLSSNGQVYLINPNGIVVGPNGRIDTGAFVASTLNLPNDAFMQGGGMTFQGDSGAGIQVLGSVTASNGDVVLIAAVVDNQGQIAAPNGQAILGAGGEVFYIPDGQSDIVIKAPPGTGAGSVSNSGTIAAASVQMKAAGSPYALAVNNSGLVSATGISQQGGRIVLDGGAGDVATSGTITAAGGAASLSGGNVAVSGTVDVSAPTGGGSIAVTASKIATVTSTAKLKASATTSGKGGSITVKAQGNADVEGSIEAKGGPQGGDGGSAEISGDDLAFSGTVDMTAPQGKTGSVLLDPADIDICALVCGTSALSIELALLGADVTVTATNSITLDSAIVSASPNNLFFDAPTTTLNAGISLPNGTLEFTNTSGTNGGTLSSVDGATVAANSIQVRGDYATVNLAGAVTAGFDLLIDQPAFTATSIDITNGANAIPNLVLLGGNTLSGDFSLATTGALNVLGALQAGGITILSFGSLVIGPNSGFGSDGTKTFGSLNGTFINDAGPALFNGAGRNLIYAATDVGLDQGGLGYTQFNPVSIGNDPAHGLADVVYIAHSSLLPVMTVTADSASRTYGTADSGFSAFVSGGTGADLASPVQFQILGGPDVNVGTYAIQPFGAISSTRALVFDNGTLTVDPALLTVTANDTTRLQGSSSPAFSASFSGLVNGDSTSNMFIFFESQGFSISPAGTYSIRPFGFSQNPNYQLQFVNGTLTIVAPPPPPPTDPFETITYLPATLSPTTPTTVTTTGTPTTLTPSEINPTGPAITVNPLIGTPLQIFGPLAETLVDQMAAAFDPPEDEATILLALKSPAIAPTIMMLLDNYLMVELDAIMNKPQSQWTADETAFVNGFLSYINAQRAAAAEKAEADYEAWAQATVAAEDAKIKQDTGEVQVMEMAALSANPPVPPDEFLAEVSTGLALTTSQSDSVVAQAAASEAASEALNGTASAGYLAYLAGDSFQIGGKGMQIMTVVTTITNAETAGTGTAEPGTMAAYKAMSREERAAWRLNDPDAYNELMSNVSKGAKTVTTTTETTADTAKSVTKTTTTVLDAADTLEAVGRIASVAGIVGEAAAIIIQTATTATQYAEQASYNNAFSAAVTKATTPLGVSDLKTMMSTGEAMTYLMAAMASGNPQQMTTGTSTAKPDMPLSQILNIEKNL